MDYPEVYYGDPAEERGLEVMRSLVVGKLYRAIINRGDGERPIFGICVRKDIFWRIGFKLGYPNTLVSAVEVPKNTPTGGPPLIESVVSALSRGDVTLIDVINNSDVTPEDILSYCDTHPGYGRVRELTAGSARKQKSRRARRRKSNRTSRRRV
jgi:hypothetical protein